ncbi:MAG: hypothetical protein DRH49_03705 [Candidatus Coatesbacteria bacterium]|nr:MAG: hypothetical protein DRH49_03705 [Candidatus Coatesbacteria bacterium]
MIRDLIKELSSIECVGSPFISLYFNLSINSRGRKNYKHFIKKKSSEIEESLKGDKRAYESFKNDLEKIERYLDFEIGSETLGVAIFACHEEGIFKTLQIPAPFNNQMTVSSFPQLSQLASKMKQGETVAVVVGDTNSVRIFFMVFGKEVEQEFLEREDVDEVRMKRFSSRVSEAGGKGFTYGGYSKKVDAYEESLIKAFVKDVSEHLDRWRRDKRYKHLILMGNENFIILLDKALHQKVKQMLIGSRRIEPFSSDLLILESAEEIYHSFLERSRKEIQKILVEENLSDGLAVVGVEPTIVALTKGQVDALVLSSDLNRQSIRCSKCAFITAAGEPKTCPLCGSGVVRSDLKEAMISSASRMNGDIWVVEATDELKRYGGVGALLRFR